MTIQTINVIVNKSIFNGAHFKESMDLALVFAAFEYKVNLIFIDDGIFNLIDNQQTQILGEKNQTDLLKGLSFYDIENIYVEKSAMSERSIETSDLLIPTNLIEAKAFNELNHIANQVIIL